ncbi:putative ribonuclease H-like domain-containing protein [Tanacetum coccineum]
MLNEMESIKKNKTWELTSLPEGCKAIGNNKRTCEEFKSSMMTEFNMFDHGKMRHFLGMEVLQNDKGIFLCQRRYAKEVLERFGMETSNLVRNPIVPGTRISCDNEGTKVDLTRFKQLITCDKTNENTALSEAQGCDSANHLQHESDENRLEQGDAYLSVIVGVSCDLRELQSCLELPFARCQGNASEKEQTIFDAPLGFVGLYTHSFTLSNLRIPLLNFFSEVLNYFKVHISRFNPFGLAKLMTFDVMCKAYGGEPCDELLRAFLNLGHAHNWTTLSNRGETNIPRATTKPFTHIEGWKGSFFYIENKIVPFEYLELLLEDNKLNKKSFKDVIPRHILKMRKENMADLDDTPSEKDEVVLIDRSVAEKAKNRKVSASSKVASKRKQTASESSGRETRQKTHKVPPQANKAVGEHSDPLDFDIFPSAKELKDFADCHWVVAHVVLDNFMNRRTHELLSTLSEARAAYDAIREREKEKDKAYAKLEAKCNDPQQDLEKNPPILDLCVEIRTLQGHYLLSFLAEATTDPYAPLEVLLSNKPRSFRVKSAPSHS